MPANIMDNDKVVLSGDEPAWHGLGEYFEIPISAEKAHDEMGGSFTLYQKPVGVQFDDGEFIEVPKSFAIVRGETNKDNRKLVFGYTTDHYTVIQPIDIIKKFDERVGVSISSLGFIQDGRKMFLSWKLPSFEVVKGDEIKLYGCLLVGYDKIFSSRINIGTIRIVCENTFMANMNEAEQENKSNRGRGTIYSGKHSNSKLLFELGEWMNHIQGNAEKEQALLQSFFKNLVNKPIKHEKQAQDLIYTAWPDPAPFNPDSIPLALHDKEQGKIDLKAARVEKIRNGVYDLYTGSEGIAIDENYYGLFNACTQYFNHKMISKKDDAFSISWGGRSAEMNMFAEVLKNN